MDTSQILCHGPEKTVVPPRISTGHLLCPHLQPPSEPAWGRGAENAYNSEIPGETPFPSESPGSGGKNQLIVVGGGWSWGSSEGSRRTS